MQTNVGRLIKTERLAQGFSQGQCARKLGLSTPQYISNIERGICSISIPNARKLCRLLKVHSETFKEAMILDFKNDLNKKWRPKNELRSTFV